MKKLLTAALLATAALTSVATIAHADKYNNAAVAKADIVDVAVANGNFTTLASLLGQAGLVETLKGDGPFTVFAPTDAAFAKLPAETVASLTNPENVETLRGILLYHVVPSKVMASDILGKKLDVATAQGQTIAVDATQGGVKINNATVVTPDVAASNGVIHVIDTVILPK